MKSIFCFGDSLTFGEKDLECGGWVERLRLAYLRDEETLAHQETLIYNLGIASETTDGLYQRIEKELKHRVFYKQKIIVSLFYGMNDIRIHKNKNLVPIPYFLRNLEMATEEIRSMGGRALLINIPPLNPELDSVVDQHGNYRRSVDVNLYNQAIAEFAGEHSLELIDVFSALDGKRNIYAADKVHLNATGHQVIYSQLKKILASIDVLGKS